MATGNANTVEAEVDEELSEESAETESFPCNFCEFSTKDIEELDEHIVTSHEEQYLKESGAETPPEIEYSIVSENEPDPPKIQEKRKFNFYDPQPSKRSKPNAESFSDLDDAECIYVCPHCGFQTTKRNSMPLHIQEHEKNGGSMIYQCSECPYQTRRKPDMPKHLLTHCSEENAEMFNCPYCTYRTKRKNDLPKHLLCHTKGGDMYSCPHCEYTTKRQGDLIKHSAVHRKYGGSKNTRQRYTGDVIHKCTECGYTGKRINDLHRHATLHSDGQYENIYKCLKCDYASTKPSSFAKHVLSRCGFQDDCIQIIQGDERDKLLNYLEGYSEEVQSKDDPLAE